MVIQNESFELFQPQTKNSKIMVTCEHATNMYATKRLN